MSHHQYNYPQSSRTSVSYKEELRVKKTTVFEGYSRLPSERKASTDISQAVASSSPSVFLYHPFVFTHIHQAIQNGNKRRCELIPPRTVLDRWRRVHTHGQLKNITPSQKTNTTGLIFTDLVVSCLHGEMPPVIFILTLDSVAVFLIYVLLSLICPLLPFRISFSFSISCMLCKSCILYIFLMFCIFIPCIWLILFLN